MLMISIGLFAVAALLGLYLLSCVLTNKTTPKGIVFMHGPIAAIALIILIVYALTAHPAPILSIIIFAVAALGGLFLFYKDMSGKPVPKAVALGHGLLAVIGFVVLLIFVIK